MSPTEKDSIARVQGELLSIRLALAHSHQTKAQRHEYWAAIAREATERAKALEPVKP